MSTERVLPKGESLRRAVRWLSEQEETGLPAIEEACRRFNLSPKDEEFLIRNFLRKDGAGDESA